ncbi:hypothetical protein SAMN05661080_02267 [Modestobacter sp. DSM 44400]|uniref:hypothetical protein n=1 Tax=Modestobacter sp. DSM 44400 TaxID=1550230 RepID=UPI00089AE7AE|nr:hypothetical protein [Modestobacter sp. DSM 44400]SDY08554.1 hypothetical protein SAMN05661080_02267 [Modestobacter sp. DSM 44400]
MGSAWVGFSSAVVVAVLTFGFGLLNLRRNTTNQRAEELRRRRVEVYSAFCAGVIEYRRAQLHRWHVTARLGSTEKVEKKAPDVAEDVRRNRATAWGRFYEVLMICNDPHVESEARAAMELARSMKESRTAEQLDAISDKVHDQVARFARVAGRTVLATDQREAAPPPAPAVGPGRMAR